MAGVELVERADLDPQPHALPEPLGHRLREPLVAAGDPVAGQRLERGGVLEHLGIEPVSTERGGDLDTREHGLGRGGRKVGSGHHLRHGGGCALARRPRHGAARGLELFGRARHAARLAHVVAHAGVGELEAEAGGVMPQDLVAVEHELGAALDHGAAGAVRPHAAADAVARLEHADVDAAVRELGRGCEAGEPGADDDDLGHAGPDDRPSGRSRAAAARRRRPARPTSGRGRRPAARRCGRWAAGERDDARGGRARASRA